MWGVRAEISQVATAYTKQVKKSLFPLQTYSKVDTNPSAEHN